jgi:molecular chaperone HtpG
MISQESYDVISPDDMNVLLLASIIHDFGLHITEDMFIRLVRDSPDRPVSALDTASWAHLWADFMGEAKRFSA